MYIINSDIGNMLTNVLFLGYHPFSAALAEDGRTMIRTDLAPEGFRKAAVRSICRLSEVDARKEKERQAIAEAEAEGDIGALDDVENEFVLSKEEAADPFFAGCVTGGEGYRVIDAIPCFEHIPEDAYPDVPEAFHRYRVSPELIPALERVAVRNLYGFSAEGGTVMVNAAPEAFRGLITRAFCEEKSIEDNSPFPYISRTEEEMGYPTYFFSRVGIGCYDVIDVDPGLLFMEYPAE